MYVENGEFSSFHYKKMFETLECKNQTQGISMEPTIHNGDWVIILTYPPSVTLSKLNRFDLIAYKSPYNPTSLVVKRIIGLPKDFVSLPPPDVNKVWAVTRKEGPTEWIRVPEGHVWCEGDNASSSFDSRYYGPVHEKLLVGKVIAKVSCRDHNLMFIYLTLYHPEKHSSWWRGFVWLNGDKTFTENNVELSGP
jgi:mitochondrial inner membrane protease subunit 1